MFSLAIFKQTLKANMKMLVVVTIGTSLMLLTMIAVFDASTIKSLGSALGGSGIVHTSTVDPFLSMLGSTFFSMQGVLLPVIFIVLTANGLLAGQVDKGSMAYLLSTPTKRTTVVRTQGIFLILSLVFMFVVVTVSGILGIHQFQSGVDIDMTKYYQLILGLFLLMFATSGISFFASSLFNLSKNSLLLGAGLPVVFFLLHLMATVSTSLDFLKYFTLNSLFDSTAILQGDNIIWNFSILGVIGLVFYFSSIFIFDKKDLPL